MVWAYADKVAFKKEARLTTEKNVEGHATTEAEIFAHSACSCLCQPEAYC